MGVKMIDFMHEFHLFMASVGIGVTISVRWELTPLLAGILCASLRSTFILMGC